MCVSLLEVQRPTTPSHLLPTKAWGLILKATPQGSVTSSAGDMSPKGEGDSLLSSPSDRFLSSLPLQSPSRQWVSTPGWR